MILLAFCLQTTLINSCIRLLSGVKELSYVPVNNWPYDGDFPFEGEMPLTVGQISGVAMLPNDSQLVILHRADRYWDAR